MIEVLEGQDILRSQAQALVNTVNCVGVMGKGLALQFKTAFPAMYASYVTACQRGELVPGRLHSFQIAATRWVVNFPTKRHWRDSSRLDDIEAGLLALVVWVDTFGLGSIAVPALGCNNGRLQWSTVRPRIEAAFSELPSVKVELYPPR